ncbi:MAG: threonine--tRNA ligase [Myxococcota bacterium]
MSMISIELPDGSKREVSAGANALDLARSISEGLARDVVVARVDGEVQDVRVPLRDGQRVQLLKADSPEGLDTLRHSAEHVLATAVVRLFPGAQVTMGPRSHDGEFYYDFDIGRSFTPDDLEKIDGEMRKIISDKQSFERKVVGKEEARQLFADLGQRFKPEILEWIPAGEDVTLYQNAEFIDLCRGPHLPHTGFIKAFKLLTTSGAYWRADASREALQRISGIAFPRKQDLDDYLHMIEEAKRRDHRRLGKELDLFLVSERYDHHEYTEPRQSELYVGVEVSPALADRSVESLIAHAVEKQVRSALKHPTELRFKPPRFEVRPDATDDDEARVHVKISAAAGEVDLTALGERGELLRTRVSEALQAELGREIGLRLSFQVERQFHEDVGPGLVLWLPKGGKVRTLVEDQWRKMHTEGGYDIVFSPHLAKSDLWKVSGHWDFYRESMFSPMEIDGQEYIAKPMNCPFHIMMVKSRARSYRDFPFRLAELGTVYRYELAGVLHGLMRVRGFTQDDAHIFCRWDQVDDEIDRVLRFILRMLQTFGFSEFEVNLSTRPEKFVGEVAEWDRAERSLEDAVKRLGMRYVVDEGGGAFYGPKIDIKLKDCLGRMWQCSTLQYDFNNPQRFDLTFINREGKPEQPVMLHRALLGSIERFIGVLVEHYAGAFPLWLAPEQVRVLTIADRHLEHAQRIGDALRAHGLRVHVPTSSEKLGAKIREAQLEKIPVMLVVGDKEAEQGGASVRLRDGTDKGFLSLDELRAWLGAEARVPEPTHLDPDPGALSAE